MLGIAIRKSYAKHRGLGKEKRPRGWEGMVKEGEGGGLEGRKGGEVEGGEKGVMVMREGDMVLMSGGERRGRRGIWWGE